MKKTIFALLALPMLLLGACSSPVKTDSEDYEALGYQYEDPSKPIIAKKDAVKFNITAPKNALADNYNDMKVFSDLNDSTNVKIEWKNMSETAYSEQKTTIMANKKNYPDAIYHAGFNDKELIQYGSSRKILVAIDEYLEYMPNLRGILEKRQDIKTAISSPDGHIYSLPRVEEMGLKEYPNILFINKEWLGKLIDSRDISFITKDDLKDGLKLKRSQYKEILRLFKSKDMNGNGNAGDEIPLSFVHNNWQGNESDLLASFGIAENVDHKTLINDRITFTLQQDTWRNAVSEIATWVKDGLIEQAAFEDSQDTFLAKGKVDSNGYEKLGSFYWWEMETVISKSQQANYIVVQPLVDDATNKQYVGVANNLEIEKGECVVFSKCEYKKVLLTYLDRFYEPYTSAQINYGPIGVVYEEELDANGKLVNKEIPEGMTADELRLKYAPMGCVYLSDYEWEHYVNMEDRAKLRLDRLNKYVKPYKYQGASPIPNINYTLDELNKLATVELNLASAIKSQFMTWMLAGTSISDSDWTNFQQKLVRLGIDTVININQAGYQRYLDGIKG